MIYLLHGNYYYFLEKKLEEIKNTWKSSNNFGEIEVVFCSDVDSVNDLHLSSSDLFATPKLTVLKDFGKLSPNISKKLFSWFSSMDKDQDIILVADSTLKSDILNELKKFTIKEFHLVKPRYESQEVASAMKFVYDYLKVNNLKFAADIPKQIVNFVGVDLFVIENELKKLNSLGLYEVTPEVIVKFLVENKSSIIFNLVNLIFADVSNYSQFLYELKLQFEDPTVFILVSSLLARELRIKYLNSGDMYLKKLYNELLEIDIQFKRGGNAQNLILEFYFLVHEESFKNFEQK